MGVRDKAWAVLLATMIELTGFVTLAPKPASAATTPTTEEQGGAGILGGGDHPAALQTAPVEGGNR